MADTIGELEVETLETPNDFMWYTNRLDVAAKYKHRHIGIPAKYPCKVHSEWEDDPNGPYTFVHTFFYQTETTCSQCGHKQLVWPE